MKTTTEMKSLWNIQFIIFIIIIIILKTMCASDEIPENRVNEKELFSMFSF